VKKKAKQSTPAGVDAADAAAKANTHIHKKEANTNIHKKEANTHIHKKEANTNIHKKEAENAKKRKAQENADGDADVEDLRARGGKKESKKALKDGGGGSKEEKHAMRDGLAELFIEQVGPRK
jgi:hypothetical protein